MRKLIPTLIVLLCSNAIFAQLKNFTFGEISEEEIQLKDCTFEKDAPAVVLFKVGRTFCYAFSNPITTDFQVHKRLKILNTKGIDEANIKIYVPARKSEGVLKKLKAQTYNIDEQGSIVISKVEPSAVYQKNITKSIAEVTFSFPKVKPGSIIEYTFTYESSDLDIENWYFQESIPTVYSGYELDFPKELIITGLTGGVSQIDFKTIDKGNRTKYVYSLDNAIAVNNEPYMSSLDDYRANVIPMLTFYDPPTSSRQDMRYTWADRMEQLMTDEDFGLQLKKNIPATKDLDDSIKLKSNDYDKMKTIYNYVQKNMQWNEVNSIWAMSGVKNAWDEKKGTLGEINCILINLLKDAKLDARPILLSTINNGFVNTANTTLRQFNKVMAYVKIKDDFYILDATEKNTSIDLIPRSVNFTEGIVINKLTKGGWGWTTAWNEKRKHTEYIYTNAKIEGDKLKGGIEITSQEYAKAQRVAAYRRNVKNYEENYYVPKQSVEIKTRKLENLDNETTPLIEKLEIEMKLNGTGEYSYFTLNTLSGLDKNVFASPNRVSDVFFGFKQMKLLSGQITISSDYEFEELPKNKKIMAPDSSLMLTRVIEKEGNTMQYAITMAYEKPFYTANEYEILFQIEKLFYQILEEQVVIKKIKK